MHFHGPFVDLPQQHGAEVQRPDPVVRLLEPHVVVLERIREEEQLRLVLPILPEYAVTYLPGLYQLAG